MLCRQIRAQNIFIRGLTSVSDSFQIVHSTNKASFFHNAIFDEVFIEYRLRRAVQDILDNTNEGVMIRVSRASDNLLVCMQRASQQYMMNIICLSSMEVQEMEQSTSLNKLFHHRIIKVQDNNKICMLKSRFMTTSYYTTNMLETLFIIHNCIFPNANTRCF